VNNLKIIRFLSSVRGSDTAMAGIEMDSKFVEMDKALGITKKCLDGLTVEGIDTVEDFVDALTDKDQCGKMHKAGVNVGQFNKLKKICKAFMPDTQKSFAIHSSPPQQQAAAVPTAAGSTPAVITPAVDLTADPGGTIMDDATAASEAILAGLSNVNIKDIRSNPQLDSAGKLWDALMKSDSDTLSNPFNPLLTSLGHSPTLSKTVPSMNIPPNDPRAALIIRAEKGVKVIHITDFISEDSKKRLANKRSSVIVQKGEHFTAQVKDDKPYAGITMPEWGAANMRLLFHMLSQGILSKENVDYYLAYTATIFDLSEKYYWENIMNYDHRYREKQAQLGFLWGTEISMMDMLLLGQVKQTTPAPNPNPRPKKGDRYDRRDDKSPHPCKNWMNSGACAWGDECRFVHPANRRRLETNYFLT